MRTLHNCIKRDGAHGTRLSGRAVGFHQLREQFLIERAAVDADAHGLSVVGRDTDHRCEVIVVLGSLADVARIDAVLGKRRCAGRVIRQKLVPVVVKVTHERHEKALGIKLRANFGNCQSRLRRIDRHAHEFAACARKSLNLSHGRRHVFGCGIRHRLHHHRRAAAHRHGDVAVLNLDGMRLASGVPNGVRTFVRVHGNRLVGHLGNPLLKDSCLRRGLFAARAGCRKLAFVQADVRRGAFCP